MRCLKNKSGLTLIELIITIALLGIVSQLIFAIFIDGMESFKSLSDFSEQQRKVSQVIQLLRADIEHAETITIGEYFNDTITLTYPTLSGGGTVTKVWTFSRDKLTITVSGSTSTALTGLEIYGSSSSNVSKFYLNRALAKVEIRVLPQRGNVQKQASRNIHSPVIAEFSVRNKRWKKDSTATGEELKAIAAWDSSRATAYMRGELVIYNRLLYRCQGNNVSPSIMPGSTAGRSHWSLSGVVSSWQDPPTWAPGVIYSENDVVILGGTEYKGFKPHLSEAGKEPNNTSMTAIWGDPSSLAPTPGPVSTATPTTSSSVTSSPTPTSSASSLIPSSTPSPSPTPTRSPSAVPSPTLAPTPSPMPTPTPTPTPIPSRPLWRLNVAYSVGDEVTYNSLAYRCTYAHLSFNGWEPNNPSMYAVWQRI